MFEDIQDYPVDPIMIGAELFAQDQRKEKLNLTVGIYQDEHGKTPVLNSVKQAELRLNTLQQTKAYTALTGDVEYCSVLGEQIFGSDRYNANKLIAAQTAGGAVALRLMADLLSQLPNSPTVWLQNPTYGNYIPILKAAAVNYQTLPYYDPLKSQLTINAMLAGLTKAKAGDVFLLQGVCHNPTGADMSLQQFDALLNQLEKYKVVPWIDLAYLGFSQTFEKDSEMARDIIDRFPEAIVCVTLSKSFGIYRDRAGALFVKCEESEQTRMHRAISAIVRSSVSHAPDHGPSVVRTILQDESLKNTWLAELSQMQKRVKEVRKKVVETEQRLLNCSNLAFLAEQAGMFSLLPLTSQQEISLTKKHGIHIVQGGRINLARLSDEDIPKLVYAFHEVIS